MDQRNKDTLKETERDIYTERIKRPRNRGKGSERHTKSEEDKDTEKLMEKTVINYSYLCLGKDTPSSCPILFLNS